MQTLKNRLYYGLKPYLPWKVRMKLRQVVADRKLRAHEAVWPINQTAARAPAGWTGWPEGKRFAFVITHDVEGLDGYRKSLPLLEVERKHGFRSSFNFIPEGEYTVTKDVVDAIKAQGFEVGVHDLKHDGKLFSSRLEFAAKAARINHYIKQWGAVGYRSGFMLRQLDWLHDLDIAYDASTFDTDPFEPMPDGAGTIFPFWIPTPEGSAGRHPTGCSAPAARGRGGYVELPYTLPQDSTLFLVLGEKSPERWLRKLDWVAQHGGMALVNVHPDYLRFPGEAPSAKTFDIRHYTRLLEYIHERYDATMWQPLPREVAAHVQSMTPPPSVPPRRRIGMLTYSDYAGDTRVIRYAEALAARGDHVDVLSIRRTPGEPREETINGVNVIKIQDRFGKNEKTRLNFTLPLLRFAWSAFRTITRLHGKNRYDLLHVHNIPDFLVYCATYPKLQGARVILDIHDIVPEFFASKFGARVGGPAYYVMRAMERVSAIPTDHVIIANDLWREMYARRTGTRDRCSVYINNVDMDIFAPGQRTRVNGPLIVLFPGGLQWHQGLDIAIRAFAQARNQVDPVEFHIYGEGSEKPALERLVEELGLQQQVRFFPVLPAREIARVMANADLGVVPKRADSFGNQAYSTKIMEFMSVGVPVVVADTEIDRFYFNDSIVRFFPSGNVEALAREMVAMLRDPALRRDQAVRASEFARQNSWATRCPSYLKLVDSLCAAS